MWVLSGPAAGVGSAGGEVPAGQTGGGHPRYGSWHLFQEGVAVAVCGQSGAHNQLVQQSDEQRAGGGDATDPEPADRHRCQAQRSGGEPLLDKPRYRSIKTIYRRHHEHSNLPKLQLPSVQTKATHLFQWYLAANRNIFHKIFQTNLFFVFHSTYYGHTLQ